MHRTTIMLTDPLRKRLARRAKELHVSVGELIRLATESYLDRQDRSYTEDPLVGNAYVIKEPTEVYVSENVDRYLYGSNT